MATRDAAVLVLFGSLDAVPARAGETTVPADLDVLLLARAATLASHAGQVAFPGGRRDDGDAGPVDTALREAVEETGLDPTGVEVLGMLAPLLVPVSRHSVTPVLGWWAQPSAVDVVDPGESAHVFRVPVADLIDPANRRTCVLSQLRPGQRRVSPAFVLPAHPDLMVWGFTGVVLDLVFEQAGWTLDWDRERTIDPRAAAR